MDLSSITAAQHQPVNQFRFDQKALDQSILRAEKRRLQVRQFYARIAAHISAMMIFLDFVKVMASLKRLG